MKKKNNKFFARTLKYLYLKLFRTHDTPQRIALGLGIGVFLGILPGAGPIAALIGASIFRANRAAAVAGALLTNTWTSLLTIVLSIKVGAGIMHLNWHDLYNQWQILLKDFHWKSLLQLSFLKIVFPVLVGYLIISAILGITTYLISLLILQLRKSKK
ncbi:MAG: DUF2062 domain-containing protein [Candidatus Omnitrophica bacterium]|nr:DUF2062 domain-containing protein [Candidatus Omnitrophota bacterium]